VPPGDCTIESWRVNVSEQQAERQRVGYGQLAELAAAPSRLFGDQAVFAPSFVVNSWMPMRWSAWIEPMLCRVFRRPRAEPIEQREPRPSEPEPQARPIGKGGSTDRTRSA
jgi:hypothetical protein